jgi:hypothetical protein
MAEWRTQDQIDADEALHVAIAAVQKAYSDDPETYDKFMLTDYVVISARVGITDDKAQNTSYDYALANGSIPWHVMMGLMDWGYMAMKDAMTKAEDDA